MIDNVNQFLGTVADTELARTARRSARTIWNAHLAAFETTRAEAGKVISLALGAARKPARASKRSSAARKATRRNMRRAA